MRRVVRVLALALAASLALGGGVVLGISSAPSQAAQASALDARGDVDATGESQDTGTGDLIHEDDPRWDCRVMGNRTCGVEIHGDRYLIEHDETGAPIGVTH